MKEIPHILSGQGKPFFEENEVREGRCSHSQDGHDYSYRIIETRNCDLVVEEISRNDLVTNWKLHYFFEPEDTWGLNTDLLAHTLMCSKDSVPDKLERLFPLESDPEITVAIHPGRIPEAYHPAILPSLCRIGGEVTLIWGTKFAPLIVKIAKFIAGECGIELNESIHIVRIQVCLLIPKLTEKYQTDDFDIKRMAGYFKKSLWRACTRAMRQGAEFKGKDLVRMDLEIDEDLEFEGSILEDGIRLRIDPDSLKAHVLEHIEHPSTVIHEHLLALGHDVHYKTIQRIKRELIEAIEELEVEPIPSFTDMVLEGKKKIRPKKLGEEIPILDEELPEEEMAEVVRLVRKAVKLAENEKA